MYNKEKNQIMTERLILRPFSIDDAQKVAELANNYNIYKSTLSLPYPYDINMAVSWIATHEANFKEDKCFEFAITDKVNGALYGAIGVSHHKEPRK